MGFLVDYVGKRLDEFSFSLNLIYALFCQDFGNFVQYCISGFGC